MNAPPRIRLELFNSPPKAPTQQSSEDEEESNSNSNSTSTRSTIRTSGENESDGNDNPSKTADEQATLLTPTRGRATASNSEAREGSRRARTRRKGAVTVKENEEELPAHVYYSTAAEGTPPDAHRSPQPHQPTTNKIQQSNRTPLGGKREKLDYAAMMGIHNGKQSVSLSSSPSSSSPLCVVVSPLTAHSPSEEPLLHQGVEVKHCGHVYYSDEEERGAANDKGVTSEKVTPVRRRTQKSKEREGGGQRDGTSLQRELTRLWGEGGEDEDEDEDEGSSKTKGGDETEREDEGDTETETDDGEKREEKDESETEEAILVQCGHGVHQRQHEEERNEHTAAVSLAHVTVTRHSATWASDHEERSNMSEEHSSTTTIGSPSQHTYSNSSNMQQSPSAAYLRKLQHIQDMLNASAGGAGSLSLTPSEDEHHHCLATSRSLEQEGEEGDRESDTRVAAVATNLYDSFNEWRASHYNNTYNSAVTNTNSKIVANPLPSQSSSSSPLLSAVTSQQQQQPTIIPTNTISVPQEEEDEKKEEEKENAFSTERERLVRAMMWGPLDPPPTSSSSASSDDNDHSYDSSDSHFLSSSEDQSGNKKENSLLYCGIDTYVVRRNGGHKSKGEETHHRTRVNRRMGASFSSSSFNNTNRTRSRAPPLIVVTPSSAATALAEQRLLQKGYSRDPSILNDDKMSLPHHAIASSAASNITSSKEQHENSQQPAKDVENASATVAMHTQLIEPDPSAPLLPLSLPRPHTCSSNFLSKVLGGAEVQRLLQKQADEHSAVLTNIQRERREEKQKTVQHLRALLDKVGTMERDHEKATKELKTKLEKAESERAEARKVLAEVLAEQRQTLRAYKSHVHKEMEETIRHHRREEDLQIIDQLRAEIESLRILATKSNRDHDDNPHDDLSNEEERKPDEKEEEDLRDHSTSSSSLVMRMDTVVGGKAPPSRRGGATEGGLLPLSGALPPPPPPLLSAPVSKTLSSSAQAFLTSAQVRQRSSSSAASLTNNHGITDAATLVGLNLKRGEGNENTCRGSLLDGKDHPSSSDFLGGEEAEMESGSEVEDDVAQQHLRQEIRGLRAENIRLQRRVLFMGDGDVMHNDNNTHDGSNKKVEDVSVQNLNSDVVAHLQEKLSEMTSRHAEAVAALEDLKAFKDAEKRRLEWEHATALESLISSQQQQQTSSSRQAPKDGDRDVPSFPDGGSNAKKGINRNKGGQSQHDKVTQTDGEGSQRSVSAVSVRSMDNGGAGDEGLQRTKSAHSSTVAPEEGRKRRSSSVSSAAAGRVPSAASFLTPVKDQLRELKEKGSHASFLPHSCEAEKKTEQGLSDNTKDEDGLVGEERSSTPMPAVVRSLRRELRTKGESIAWLEVQLAESQKKLNIAKADLIETEASVAHRVATAEEKERARVAEIATLLQKRIEALTDELDRLRRENSVVLVSMAEERAKAGAIQASLEADVKKLKEHLKQAHRDIDPNASFSSRSHSEMQSRASTPAPEDGKSRSGSTGEGLGLAAGSVVGSKPQTRQRSFSLKALAAGGGVGSTNSNSDTRGAADMPSRAASREAGGQQTDIDVLTQSLQQRRSKFPTTTTYTAAAFPSQRGAAVGLGAVPSGRNEIPAPMASTNAADGRAALSSTIGMKAIAGASNSNASNTSSMRAAATNLGAQAERFLANAAASRQANLVAGRPASGGPQPASASASHSPSLVSVLSSRTIPPYGERPHGALASRGDGDAFKVSSVLGGVLEGLGAGGRPRAL